ncbi:MAG: acetoacetyl-CoA synthetase [Candidatus Endobugula sp.]|jgi:acetoacetyl-CoA synthetase
MNNQNNPLWTPSQSDIDKGPMSQFARKAEKLSGERFTDYADLHRWSVSDVSNFWDLVWDDASVVGDKGRRVLINQDTLSEAQFFPDAALNFAENLLSKKTDDPAIIFRREDGVQEILSWKDLNQLVSLIQQAMLAYGVSEGDRIVGMLPNAPQAIAIMLAAASLGAIWSSCSPDFGEKAVVDRFGQIQPTLFFSCDGYYYNGKIIDLSERLEKIAPQLGVDATIIISFIDKEKTKKIASALNNGFSFTAFVDPFTPCAVTFKRLPFSHPLYILFSSGTTGAPKCIIHSAGGTLLQHIKELRLHCGLEEGDRAFYYTTCGWMMWNWLVSALACRATVMLYDGSPFYPDGNVLFDYAEQEKFTLFGTSAKYIDSVRHAGLSPINTHDLSSVRLLASTGSPLMEENFSYVYSAIKKNVQLASISGGTDIVACFVGGVPWKPVFTGEIQGAMLAMDVKVFNNEGQPVNGEKGELVCCSPFPSMPIGFWNDIDDKKYHQAYYNRFDNIWCQGDFAEFTQQEGFIIHGRSDATLNPGGVRIGTAEIYNQIEQLEGIEEGLCVGQEWHNDTRIILFVRLAVGVVLDDEFKNKVRKKIRSGTSPRHVPAVIIAVSDLPRTKSGKIAELSVREIIHGRVVNNEDALANPESLTLFKHLADLN